MIIVKFSGGLGNQLQQYALYEKFRYLGIPVKADLSWFEESVKKTKVRELELLRFENVRLTVCTKEEKEALTGKDHFLDKCKRVLRPESFRVFHESQMYHPEIFQLKDAYLSGYWACESYYADILSILQKILLFPESRNPKNTDIALAMKQECSVSIHIRRGDYLDPENEAMFGNICTEAYYKSAIETIEKAAAGKGEQVRFYLFSDDPEYVRKHYTGEQFITVDWNIGEESWFDMYLMSMCRHNICANSTFSFWGARLNETPDKIMIRPLKHKNSQMVESGQMRELWKKWILIEADGRVLS
ncbi:MAG: alpha-1,2-fucosyltransferase [Lachnospiraceae bacterium]|nr:alpha-1,2-fucosyltransferase [Lachnospiraceae bacterium]